MTGTCKYTAYRNIGSFTTLSLSSTHLTRWNFEIREVLFSALTATIKEKVSLLLRVLVNVLQIDPLRH